HSQQGDLAEGLTRSHLAQFLSILADADPAVRDHVKALSGFPILNDYISGLEGRRLQFAGQVLNNREGQRAEEGHLAQQRELRAARSCGRWPSGWARTRRRPLRQADRSR